LGWCFYTLKNAFYSGRRMKTNRLHYTHYNKEHFNTVLFTRHIPYLRANIIPPKWSLVRKPRAMNRAANHSGNTTRQLRDPVTWRDEGRHRYEPGNTKKVPKSGTTVPTTGAPSGQS
jgi:hypothetical protein